MWKKSGPQYIDATDSISKLTSFCEGLSFYQAANLAFASDLIKHDLYSRLDSIRGQRNNVIHQLWLYEHRNDTQVLRTELEKLAKISSELVVIFNRLSKKFGFEEIYTTYLSRWGKLKKGAKK
jgi:hypothetical protein